MSTGTNKERITQNNGIINENNADLNALKTRINNLPTSGDTTATAGDILLGKTAVSKGVKITGTYEETKAVLPDGIKFGVSESNSTDFSWLADCDTSNFINTDNMFKQCVNMTTIELFDMSNVTSMAQMFYYCSSLTAIPQFNTSNVVNMNEAFCNCTMLSEVPILNTENAQRLWRIFSNCPALSNQSLNNILAMCIGATQYVSTKTLYQIGLSRAQAETCQTLSNWDAFVAARLEYRLLIMLIKKYIYKPNNM